MAGGRDVNGRGQPLQILSAPAHFLRHDQVIEELGSHARDGLHVSEAQGRLSKHGKNILEEGESVNPIKILVGQIANSMTLVLVLAMIISFIIKSYIEGGVIAAVVLINVTVGFFQEFAAEKTMNSLRELSSPTATAVRGGETMVVPSVELVPGDVVELKTGDTIPADLRLLETSNLETDEALLTGESLPVPKDSEATFPAETGPGDRLNVAYSSSTVTKGRGLGIVYATGMKTEIGSIAAALRAKGSKRRKVKRKADGTAKPHRYVEAGFLTIIYAIGRFLGVSKGTPLQKQLSRLAMLLFGIAVVFAIIVEASNGFSSANEVVIYAVATGLSMIPASLVVILTITMALGTKQMAKRHVVVRKLQALEALGAVTNICSDKTGTLTQGKMIAKKAWIPGAGTYTVGESKNALDPTDSKISHVSSQPCECNDEKGDDSKLPNELLKAHPVLEGFLNIAALANVARVYKADDGHWNARGDPTEIAIEVFACRFDWYREKWTKGEKPKWFQIAEFPFDSDVKKMSTIYARDSLKGSQHLFSKGAVERVLECCTNTVSNDNSREPFSEDHKAEVLLNVDALASQGLRVLALASKELEAPFHDDKTVDRRVLEQNLTFVGLIGLYDPPRPESARAVRKCHEAGVKVAMLTGDHPETARAIAAQVGIMPSRTDILSAEAVRTLVMTASQFDQLSNEEVDKLPFLPLVIARCTPHTKVRMIEAIHRRKGLAAMTGDGVNDSPSLKQADVGIAMGQAGSDVAKEASDIVLTDDNFASILNAVEEGRRIFDNIQKFVLHLLAQNVAQACTLLVGLAFKDSTGTSVFPLSPVEILWVIMITSSIPDMGLGMEKAAADIMKQDPHSLKFGVFSVEVMVDILAYGLWMALLCLSSFSVVLFGFGDGGKGEIGDNCNKTFSAGCAGVFRARTTTFVCMTWFSLFLAWEMLHPRRSFFRMRPESHRPFTQWMYDVWDNKFLFFAVLAGFVTVFPTLYIPVINHDVFKHEGISWEWGVVFVQAVLFILGSEFWKWCKRIYFRHYGHKADEPVEEDVETRVFKRYDTDISMSLSN